MSGRPRHTESPDDTYEHFLEAFMKSSVIKRSVVFNGHKTSVSLEDAFWNSLKEIAHTHGVTMSKLVAEIDNARQHNNLSSAVRLFILDQFRTRRRGD